MEENVDFNLVLLRMKQGNQDRLIKNMNSFLNDLKCISPMSPYAAINYIRKKVGYDVYIYSYCRKEGIDSDLFMSSLTDYRILQGTSVHLNSGLIWFLTVPFLMTPDIR